MANTYTATYQLNAEVIGKQNVDIFNKALETGASRVQATEMQVIRLAASMRTLTDQGLGVSRAFDIIAARARKAGDTIQEGFINQVKRAFRDLNQHLNPSPVNPGGGGGGGGIFGRVGGRLIGAEVLGRMGIPGGGFIGSQLAGGLGLTGGAALGLLGAGVGAIGIYEFAKHANDVLKYAQAQRNLSNELGVTISQMDTLSRVSEVTGVKLEGTAKAVQELREKLIAGGARGREAELAFGGLGLSTSTAFENPAEATTKIAEALSKVENAGRRAQLAIDLLGPEAGRALAAIAGDFTSLSEKLKVDDDTLQRLATAKDRINAIWELVSRKFLITVDFLIQGGNTKTYKNDYQKVLDQSMGEARARELGLWDAPPPKDPTRGGITTGPSLAMVQDANRKVLRSAEESSLNPEARYSAEIADIKRRREEFNKQATGEGAQYLSPSDIRRTSAGFDAEVAAAEERKKKAEKTKAQEEELKRYLTNPETIPGTESFWKEIDRRYPDAGLYMKDQIRGVAIQHMMLDEEARGDQIIRAEDVRQAAQTGRNIARDTAEGQRDVMGNIQSAYGPWSKSVEDRLRDSRTRSGQAEAGIGVSTAQAGLARTRLSFGLTPAQIARLEYEDSLRAIQETTGARADALMEQSRDLHRGATGISRIIRSGLPGIADNDKRDAELSRLSEAREHMLVEAEQKKLEAESEQLKAITESTNALNRLSEASVKAAEEVRSQFSEGIVSVMLGAQRGAYTGRGGQGAANAARAVGEKLEGQLLTNVIGHVVYGNTTSGAGGVLNKIGSKLPDWLTRGTVLQHVDPQAELRSNTTATVDNTTAIYSLTNLLSGGKTPTGTDAGGLPVFSPWAGSGGLVALSSLGGFGGGSSGAAGEVASAANAAAALAGMTTGSARQDLQAAAKSLSMVARIGGMIYAGASDPIGVLAGTTAAPGGSSQLAMDVGAASRVIAAGIGFYEGVSTAAKGGAKNITGGIAGALAAAGSIPSPATPFLEAGAAALGFASTLIPDPHVVREQQIARAIFTQQYLAPQAIHMTAGDNAGYSDVDMFGIVRTSNLSPYPVSTNPYEDVPRRTIVPGRTTSQFGGNGTTTPSSFNQTPPPVYNIHVHAMDSKSIIDRAGDIVDAFHKGIMQGPTQVVNTLAQKMGLR